MVVVLVMMVLAGCISVTVQEPGEVAEDGLSSRNETASPMAHDGVRVHFINAGQGDVVYIQLPGAVDILINGGSQADGSTVIKYLQDQKVDDIELLVATYPDENSIGGLPAVLKAYKIDKVIDSGETAGTQAYADYIAAVKAEGCEFNADAMQLSIWGDCSLEILSCTTASSDSRDKGVVCKLTYKDTGFLFPGNAGAAELLSLNDISADVFKVGDHGSARSTSPELLAKIKPELAVISTGNDAEKAGPDPQTLNNLKAAGVSVYRNDEPGAIVVIGSDGATVMLEPGS